MLRLMTFLLLRLLLLLLLLLTIDSSMRFLVFTTVDDRHRRFNFTWFDIFHLQQAKIQLQNGIVYEVFVDWVNLVAFRSIVFTQNTNSNKSKWFPWKHWMLAKLRPNTQRVDLILKIVVGEFGTNATNRIINYSRNCIVISIINGNVTSTIDHLSSINFSFILHIFDVI